MKNLITKIYDFFTLIGVALIGLFYYLITEYKKSLIIGLILGLLIIVVKQHYRYSAIIKERNELYIKNEIKTEMLNSSLKVINNCGNQTLMLLEYKFDKKDTLQLRHLIKNDTVFVKEFNNLNEKIKKDLEITFKILK